MRCVVAAFILAAATVLLLFAAPVALDGLGPSGKFRHRRLAIQYHTNCMYGTLWLFLSAYNRNGIVYVQLP